MGTSSCVVGGRGRIRRPESPTSNLSSRDAGLSTLVESLCDRSKVVLVADPAPPTWLTLCPVVVGVHLVEGMPAQACRSVLGVARRLRHVDPEPLRQHHQRGAIKTQQAGGDSPVVICSTQRTRHQPTLEARGERVEVERPHDRSPRRRSVLPPDSTQPDKRAGKSFTGTLPVPPHALQGSCLIRMASRHQPLPSHFAQVSMVHPLLFANGI